MKLNENIFAVCFFCTNFKTTFLLFVSVKNSQSFFSRMNAALTCFFFFSSFLHIDACFHPDPV